MQRAGTFLQNLRGHKARNDAARRGAAALAGIPARWGDREIRRPKTEIRPAALASAKPPAQPGTARQRGERKSEISSVSGRLLPNSSTCRNDRNKV